MRAVRRDPGPGGDRNDRVAGFGKRIGDMIRVARLTVHRHRLDPDRLEPGRWWNGSLRTEDQLRTVEARATAARLPLSGDRDRDWDALESLELILAHSGSEARIADIGLHAHRPLLDWLEICGYRDVQCQPEVGLLSNRTLSAVGAGERGAEGDGGEPYQNGTEGMPRPEAQRDIVLCRSVPGDRIPLAVRLIQGRRLLRPAGILILSTEYWDLPAPYQDGERRCAEDHFCCRNSVEGLVREATDLGMVPVAPVYTGPVPEERHPGLLGIGVAPLKLAFRKR